MKLNFDRYQF